MKEVTAVVQVLSIFLWLTRKYLTKSTLWWFIFMLNLLQCQIRWTWSLTFWRHIFCSRCIWLWFVKSHRVLPKYDFFMVLAVQPNHPGMWLVVQHWLRFNSPVLRLLQQPPVSGCGCTVVGQPGCGKSERSGTLVQRAAKRQLEKETSEKTRRAVLINNSCEENEARGAASSVDLFEPQSCAHGGIEHKSQRAGASGLMH